MNMKISAYLMYFSAVVFFSVALLGDQISLYAIGAAFIASGSIFHTKNKPAKKKINNEFINEPMQIVIKRILAFIIDYAVIAFYIFILLFLSTFVNRLWPFHQLMESSYLFRHLISFFTLTVPVVLYFILMERSDKQATIGKTMVKIKVVNAKGGRASLKHLIIRNTIKFIPWEVAHTFIHINYAVFSSGKVMGMGSMLGLIIPQLIALAYLTMILFRDDRRSLYEILSRTRVQGFGNALYVNKGLK